jgi:hypothetical protein
MANRRDALLYGVGGVLFTLAGPARALERNTFTSGPELVPGTGKWKLTKNFAFKDNEGTMWKVNAPYLTDGASIPSFLWSLVGHPMQTEYFKAALIHDAYCDSMKRSWEKTHRVFYDAMRAQGLEEGEATTKYWAVHKFGPRWNATHRWTSFLELAKRPRRDVTLPSWSYSVAAVAAAPPPPGWSEATEVANAKLLAYQEAEFARAAALIAQGGLSPEAAEALPVSAPFDYAAEREAAYRQLGQD